MHLFQISDTFNQMCIIILSIHSCLYSYSMQDAPHILAPTALHHVTPVLLVDQQAIIAVHQETGCSEDHPLHAHVGYHRIFKFTASNLLQSLLS